MNVIAAIKPIKQGRWWLSPGGLVSALLAALLPKCPLCFMAYAGVAGLFGIDPFIYSFWIMPVTIAFSVFTLAILFLQAGRNRRYLPFFTGLLAISFILLDKFYLNSNLVFYVALVLLLASLIWATVSTGIPAKTRADKHHCIC